MKQTLYVWLFKTIIIHCFVTTSLALRSNTTTTQQQPETEKCDFPANVPDCQEGSPPPITPTPRPSTTNDPIDWVCPEGYDGFTRHPYNCTLFYLCYSTQEPCLYECSHGLYYNPTTERCDWPDNVPGCEDGFPPPSTTTPMHMKNGKTLIDRNAERLFFENTMKQVAKMLRLKFTGKALGDHCYVLNDSSNAYL